MPDYTLFDVKKGDAHRVISALKNVDFFGTKLKPAKAGELDFANRESGKRKKGEGKEKGASKLRGESKKKGKPTGANTKSKKGKGTSNYEIFYKKKR